MERLASLQIRRPWIIVIAGLLLAALSMPLVLQLGLNSAFTALLPKHKPSVTDMEKIRGRVGGLNTLTIAIQSKDVEAMQRFAADLVKRLEGVDRYKLRSVEWNVAAYEDFILDHRELFAKLADLEEVRDSLEDRLDYERAHANPLFVSLEDDEPPSPEEIVERMKGRADDIKKKKDRFPGGYYVHEDRDLLAVFLRTDIRGGDVKTTKELQGWVEGEVAKLGPAKYAADMKIEYAGDLTHGQEEHDAIARELVMATGLTILLVFVVIFIFFRRLSPIALMGISLAVPTIVTFACAELAVDFLNTSTAFLGSIVIGNGINPNIIWLARYFEERRGGRDIDSSVIETHRRTWIATATASSAAAIAYGSLVITDFRGFRDFGIIGGIGMILCWFGAIVMLPAVTVLYDRARDFGKDRRDSSSIYGRAFSAIVFKAPGTVLVVSLIATTAGVGYMIKAVIDDPIEYSFRKLRSVREKSSRASKLNARVKEIVGGSGAGQAIAMVLDSTEDAAYAEAQLEAMRPRFEREDPKGVPYARVRAIHNLLPKNQDKKIPVIGEIRDLMLEVRPYAKGKQLEKIDEYLPPEKVAAVTMADLPEQVARRFTERDGTRGRLLFIEQQKGKSLWNGRFLVRWAKALREVRLEDGSRPPLAGRATVFADMIEVVWTDGPKAVLASFLATLLLVSFAFRTGVQRFLSMAALLVGIVWMGGTMAMLGMKLNFLNFVAFPITFGNGVDYGVNVMRRFVAESAESPGRMADSVRASIEGTGGAVVLCSMTTIIGYSSLYVSSNKALNSFGSAMAISEITCLLAAVLAMPAALLLLARRKGG